jgi:hypothetical protein
MPTTNPSLTPAQAAVLAGMQAGNEAQRPSQGRLEIFKALFAAKQRLKAIAHDSQGQYGTYTSLEHVNAEIDPVLHQHGLMVIQTGSPELNGAQLLHTTLVHVESGQTLDSVFRLTPDKQGPQGMGAALTYMRRHAKLTILGIATGGDPDAQFGHATPNQTHSNLRSVGTSTASNRTRAPVIPPRGTPPLSGNPRDFRINFGKYEGRTLSQIGMDDLLNYCDWLQQNALKSNKPVGVEAQKLIDAVYQLDHEEKNANEGPPAEQFAPLSDQIPF